MWRVIALALTLAMSSATAQACNLPPAAASMMGQMGAAANAARSTNDLSALSRNALLDTAAQRHACWISVNGKFGHEGANGSKPSDRIKAAGYRPRVSSENLAAGQNDASSVVADWMKSKGHRENILRKNVSDYGVGVALLSGRPVWVMVFAAR